MTAVIGVKASQRKALDAASPPLSGDNGVVSVDGLPALAPATEAWDDFTVRANGALADGVAALPSGQTYNIKHEDVAVTSGRLVATNIGTAVASYVQVPLTNPGIRVGTRLTFSAYSTDGGAASIGFWETPIDDSDATPIEDSPCHFNVSPDAWSFAVWENGSIVTIQSAYWDTPLTADGSTIYTVEIFIDREADTAYVSVIDDSGAVLLRQTFTDARIGAIEGNYAYIEHYRVATTNTLPSFLSWWADSMHPAALAQAQQSHSIDAVVDDYQRASVYLRYAPLSLETYTVGGSLADIDATDVILPPIVAPASGRIWVEASFVIGMSAADGVYVAVASGVTSYETQELVSAKELDGFVHYKALVTGLAAGSAYSFKLQAFHTGGATVEIYAHEGTGRRIYMRATPA